MADKNIARAECVGKTMVVWMNVLVADELDLPKRLPAHATSGAVERKRAKSLIQA